MAWIFGLSAECGPDGRDAARLARHFESRPSVSWTCGVAPDRLGNWWCIVAPKGLSESGVRSAQDAASMTAEGHRLYEALRSAPPTYRYALAGVETDGFRLFDELADEVDLTGFPGLVVADELWQAIGRPRSFEPFAPGYRWIPYPGEPLP